MELRSSPGYIWNIKDVLGQGATGAVYKGRDKKTGNEVAIKVTNHLGMMRPIEVRKREFEVLSRLDHENIVSIFASENELRSQNEIIAMELCTGGSLYALLEHPSNAYGFAEEDCKEIIKDIVAGMEHLRKQGIVHRDLKPGNILRFFREDGTCTYKLTDFGAARELEHSAEQFLSIYGTEEYLHPDLYERGVLRKSSGKTFGANVDLWSIGVTLYHIATGKLPFRPQGGRQNKDVMYHITTAKKTGMISGVQSRDGNIEWSDRLPDHTNLSRGFQELLVPILAGVMESDPSKMMSFSEFFSRVQDMVTRKVVEVFHVQKNSFHRIYIQPQASFEAFQEMLTNETGLQPAYQTLIVKGERVTRSVAATVDKFPDTSRENPMILVGGEFVPPKDLAIIKIPSVTQLAEQYTLEADAAAAKIRANCAYACKLSTRLYTDIVNGMCIALDAVLKTFKTTLLYTAVHCGEVESRRITTSYMTKVCCSTQERLVTLIEGLLSQPQLPDGERASMQLQLTTIKRSIHNKRQSNQEIDKVKNIIENLKVYKLDVVDNDSYSTKCSDFKKLAKGKLHYEVVSNLTTKIEEIYNRYRREKNQRRLSYPDEQNHIYERKRLDQLTDQVKRATRESFEHRVNTYNVFINIFGEINLLQAEADNLKDQLLRIAPADEAHLVTLETFQNECVQKYEAILSKLSQSMQSAPSSSVGTDLPSLPSSNGMAEEVVPESLMNEIETQITSMFSVTDINIKMARENTDCLKELTGSFTDFYKLLTENETKALQELKELQESSETTDSEFMSLE